MIRFPLRCLVTRLPLIRDRRGVALVEFAFTLPFLILLYVGGYQFTDALSAYRKVTTATRTIADLTSQYVTVDDSDLATVLNASQQVMSPYSPDKAEMTVTQVVIDDKGNAKVDWSKGKNTSGLTKGTAFTVPNSIKQNSTSIIVAEIFYDYTPVIASSLLGPIRLHDQIVLGPRATDTIVHK